LQRRRADASPVSLAESLRAMRRRLSSPAYLAEAELWAAARTDPALADALVPVERKLGEQLRHTLDRALATLDERWRADVAVVALHYVRGLAALDALRRPPGGPPSPRRAARVDAELAPLLRLVEALGRGPGGRT
jgi:hypothetical protein